MRQMIENPGEADYARAARTALDEGHLDLAFEQIGAALSFDPLSAEHLTLLQDIIRVSPKPLESVRGDGERFFGAMAVRAHVLAGLDEIGQAIDTLADVIAFRPSIPYFAWARHWVTARQSTRGIRLRGLLDGLSRFRASLRGQALEPGARVNVEHAAWLLERLAEDRGASVIATTVLASSLLRCIDQGERAEALMLSLAKKQQAWEIEAELATLLREKGDLDGAAERLSKASERWPQELALKLDWLSLSVERNAADQVIAIAEAMTHAQLDPVDRKAVTVSVAYARSVRAPLDLDHRRALSMFAVEPVSTSLTNQLALRRESYLTELPSLRDAWSSVVRSALFRAVDQRPPSLRVRVRGSDLPPASARQALRDGLGELGIEGGFADQAIEEGPVLDEALAKQVSARALSTFDLDSWCAASGSGISITDVTNILHSPPRPRCGRDPVDRLHLVQLAALSLTTLRDASVLDWLEAMSRGADTWLGASAIAIWGALARSDSGLRERALGMFAELGEQPFMTEDARGPALVSAWTFSGARLDDSARARIAAIAQEPLSRASSPVPLP